MAPSRHDWKIVDRDFKPQHNQPTNSVLLPTGMGGKLKKLSSCTVLQNQYDKSYIQSEVFKMHSLEVEKPLDYCNDRKFSDRHGLGKQRRPRSD